MKKISILLLKVLVLGGAFATLVDAGSNQTDGSRSIWMGSVPSGQSAQGGDNQVDGARIMWAG